MLPRILPISSLRFILALWVVLGHFAMPLLRDPQQQAILKMLRAVLNNSFNGPAAVIVFFVISGFCIHYPNRNGLVVRSWKAYYLRRYLRILLPMSAAIALSLPLGMKFGLFTDSILWSLLCEEIYYFLYPFFLSVQSRFGWKVLFGSAWALSIATVLTDPGAGDYPVYGASLNWALGLPCWLMGFRLAGRFDSFIARPVSFSAIWRWRITIWALSGVCSVLKFHTPIGYPWTLNLFALAAMLWVEREIRFYESHPVQRPMFERAGNASYSIYLTHVHSAALFTAAGFSAATWAGWFFLMVVCAAFTAIFYFAIERPSHGLARKFGRPTRIAVAAAA